MLTTSKVGLGYLLIIKCGLLRDGESFKVGRAHIKADDVFRCISVDGDLRVLVSQRTGTAFTFHFNTLAAKFHVIGFDGLETITELIQ